MSKSIRSYFTIIRKQTDVSQEDSDEIPESPDVQIKKKKPSKKKRLIEDSDDEIFTPKKKKIETTPKSKNHKSPKPALKEVTVTDLFGNSKVKKTDALVIKDKTKKKTETGIHSDDEFEQSLLELDEPKDNVDKPGSKEKSEENKNEQMSKIKKEDKLDKELHPSVDSKQKKKDISPRSKEQNKKEVDKSQSHVNSSTSKTSHKLSTKEEQHIKHNHDSIKSNNKKVNQKLNCANVETEKSGETLHNKDNKRDLSDFLEMDDNQESNQKNKKKKHDISLNDSVLTDEERHERKRHSAALYQKYLNRSGPKHLGSKEIPEGAPDCLKDCAFLLTGVLDSFERDEIVAAITKYGGSVKSGISKKVTHVLAGEDAGPAKLAKAEELKITIINEDDFLKMIIDKSNKNHGNASQNNKPKIKIEKESSENHGKSKKSPKDNKLLKGQSDNREMVKKERSVSPKKEKVSPKKEKIEGVKVKKEKHLEPVKKEENIANGNVDPSKIYPETSMSLMWVDKYKPTNIKQIIGQHGEASNVKKLMNWLTKWYINRKAKLAKPNPWAKNDDGGYYRAALLSGPPGVGKTTTVSLVCKELGFDMVEFNASDTRSKNLIKEQITELLSTTSLSGFARGETGKQAVTKKHVLVMDEVDGMAGNEDRGGLQELISLIKTASVPVICMCNDRNSEKMRSLVNYCYDLRFSRPRVDQIKAAMMSVCFKEGVKVSPDVVSQLVAAAGQDVRQTLHLLAVWAARPAHASARPTKDVKIGPWEAIRKVFSAEEHKTMSLNDRSDLFFSDYSLAPLFVHENYLQVAPHCPKKEVLDRLSQAADSISLGDLVEARIRGNQAWSLLPTQAMFSSVIPGQALSGHVAGQIQFPGWLGKNSRAGKMARLAQAIHAHTRLSTSGSKSSIFLDYASHLRDAVLNPLIQDKMDGIQRSLQVLEEYHLLRDDLESLTELSLWPGQRNPNVLVDSKVKAAMTRTYNKQASALPYAPGAVKKAKHTEDTDSQEFDEEDVQEDSDPENDALIKKKKTKDVEKPSTIKEKGQSSKGKKKK